MHSHHSNKLYTQNWCNFIMWRMSHKHNNTVCTWNCDPASWKLHGLPHWCYIPTSVMHIPPAASPLSLYTTPYMQQPYFLGPMGGCVSRQAISPTSPISLPLSNQRPKRFGDMIYIASNQNCAHTKADWGFHVLKLVWLPLGRLLQKLKYTNFHFWKICQV